MIDDLDLEALQPLRDGLADVAETEDAHRLARQLAAERTQFGVDPFVPAHRAVSLRQAPNGGEDEHDRVLGHGAGIGAGRDRHRHAFLLGRHEVDLVDADAPFVHQAELGRFLQQLLGDRRRDQAEIRLANEMMRAFGRVDAEAQVEFRRRHLGDQFLRLGTESAADDSHLEFVGLTIC